MPWDRTQLWVAEIGTEGTLGVALQVAGDVEESILQPAFSPTGELWFSSDRSGYWNLHRWQGGDPGDVEAMTKLDAEVGGPQWVFGTSVYAFSGSRVVFAANHLGEWRLYALEEQQVHALPCPWTEIHYLRSEGSTAFFLAASRRERPSVAAVDLDSGEAETLHRPSLLEIEAAFVSEPRVIEFPSTEGATSFGFFYPPCNAEMEGPRGEKPPLLVLSHGGPTAAASSALSPEIQFWTSRGIAVVDVNYRGSSGFGRAYRTSLDGNWGVFDVDDCVAAAEFLAQRGEIDPDRVDDPWRQRGRLHHSGGSRVSRCIQGRGELLRYWRSRGPGSRYPQIRVTLCRASGRALPGDGGALPAAISSLCRGSTLLPDHLFSGPGGIGWCRRTRRK